MDLLKKIVVGVFLTLFILSIADAHQIKNATLLEVYKDAVVNDPQYRADRLTLEELQQNIPIARSDLLPQVSLIGEYSKTQSNSSIDGIDDNYDSSHYGVNFNQSIFNFDALYRLRHAKADVKAAAARFSFQQQDLILRVIRAYLAASRARDLMFFTLAQVQFATTFYDMAQEKKKVKFTTITDASQGKLQLELMQARYATAKVNYENALDDLSILTEKHYQSIKSIHLNRQLIRYTKAPEEKWVALAKKQNLDLKAARLTVEAARQAIEIPKTGFLPNLNGFVRYSDRNGLDTNLGRKQVDVTREVNTGLSASWQIIQGGQTISEVRQARKSYEKAMALANLTYLNVIAQTRKAVANLDTGKRALDQAAMALNTGTKSMKYTQDGFKAGVESMFDLLQAQNRLFSAQQTYVDSYYRYILNIALLKQAVGTLSPEDILALSYRHKRK